MKKIFVFYMAFVISGAVFAQPWQQQVDFVIDVTLNDKDKTLQGFEKIIYKNVSPDTLHFIWFHLWANAYKNDQTAFSDQLLVNGNTKFYFSNPNEKGYVNRLDFKVNGATAKIEDHPEHIDIIRIILPQPLLPKQQVTITTPFHVKLPFNYSRGGYDGESFQITQWYPKPAVYDKAGWHPMPYLDQGEFYSEFGNFDVRITLPENYVVAATGNLITLSEQTWLKGRTNDNWGKEYNTTIKQKKVNGSVKSTKPLPVKKDAAELLTSMYPPSSPNVKTIRFVEEHVHDFAWFADKRFIAEQDTCLLPGGKTILVKSFYTPQQQTNWKESIPFAKAAIRFYSEALGNYPYDGVSVVQGPESFGGGMEYPTITIVSAVSSLKVLDQVIAHEAGHNWFYGILASNERDHPWMDEGMNTFYEQKYMESRYGTQNHVNELVYQTKIKRKTAQPIGTRAHHFNASNYALAAYDGTASWLRKIEQAIGENSFKTMMQAYYTKWEFMHPQPADFIALASTYLEKDTSLLSFIYTPLQQSYKGFRFISPVKKGVIKGYFQMPVKDIMLLSPALGINYYDKLMLGALLTNYKIPPNNLQYLFIAMYGTGSGNFTGLGKLNYSLHSDRFIRKTDFFINGASFTKDEFKDTAGNKLSMNFKKLVPGIRLTFREKNKLSTVRQYLQWKTFLFREQNLRIIPDTNFNGTDTTIFLRYLLPEEDRWLNQLQFVYQNNRALYPFDVTFQVEQAKDFIRPAITANYFFNYREGGLHVRLFGGKFIYLNGKNITKQFSNDRYFLNMTGPNGFEDYTYSDYFIGRNQFNKIGSQQIVIRDGGFKTRTDLLANKIGKTDNWLLAANLNTTIPKRLNPFSVLPFTIPLHIFADVGSYAEAWERDTETDRFLFSVGFHIPLFHESLNIYIPVLYNNVYADYYKSTIPKNRFLKTISFSIHFYNSELKKVNHELEF